MIQNATQPTVGISLTKIGPWYYNGPGFLTERNAQLGQNGFFVWGSFDGSTNEPIAYPSGTSIKALEAQLFGY